MDFDNNNGHIPTMPQGSGSGHIPTVPQGSGSGHIATVPQGSGSGHIATVPQGSGSGHIATVPQGSGSGHIATVPQGSDTGHIATVPQENGLGHISTVPQYDGGNYAKTGSGLLFSEVVFTADNGRNYIINGRQPISTDTGEAQIYRCHAEGSDIELVAKILISLRPDAPQTKIRTRNKVLEFLDKYSRKADSSILPLLAHGILNIGGEEYFTDIYPYCSSGAFVSGKTVFSLNDLKKRVIPDINKALNLFHKAGFVHRDLKPDNLYFYKDRVVVGDFGITCDLNTDGYAVDEEKFGTLGYYAPELMSKAARIESDYYSFGQTLWTLYHGEEMYRETIRSHGGYGDENARNAVNNRMMDNEFPGLDEIDKKDSFFEILIKGLLQYDPSARFGYDEVVRWLNDDQTLYMEIRLSDDKNIFTRTITINGKDCINNEQVAKCLSMDWEAAKKTLFGDLYNLYKFTLQRDEDAELIKAYRDMAVDKIQISGIKESDFIASYFRDISLSGVILALSDFKMLCWRGGVYRYPHEISETIDNINKFNLSDQRFDILDLINSHLIKLWIENLPIENKKYILKEIDNLHAMFSISDEGKIVSYYWLKYMLQKDRKNAQFKKCFNVDDIARMLLAGPEYLYESVNDICCVNNLRLLGFLSALGYDSAMKSFVKVEAKYDYKKYYEIFFDFLENSVQGEDVKELVHNAYASFGPRAYLIWWKNNIDAYSFFGKKANDLKNRIEDTSFDAGWSLAQQRSAFTGLEQAYDEFTTLFTIDYYLALSGIRTSIEKDYIYSGKLSAVLKYSFLGQMVPLGFKYFLKI